MTKNYHERNHWVGTDAEMALCTPVNPGAVWFQTNTLDSYWWDGGSWNAMGGGGGGGCFVCDVTNTYGGDGAFVNHTADEDGTAVGYQALHENLGGAKNTAVGSGAAENNTTGYDNIAIGYQALHNNLTEHKTIAIGNNALHVHTAGRDEMAIGDSALMSDTTGFHNLAIGNDCMKLTTTGYNNIAVGSFCLALNTIGDNNIAVGCTNLWANISGSGNTALGSLSIFSNCDGNNNVGVGIQTLMEFITGNNNIAIGDQAMVWSDVGDNNIAIGDLTLSSVIPGNENIAIGLDALAGLWATFGDYIDSFSDYSGTVPGTVKVHSHGNGLPGGITIGVMIWGTINYDGVVSVTKIDADNFYFTHAWLGDDAITNWWSYWTVYDEASYNVAIGAFSGYELETGKWNTFLGYQSGYDVLQDIDCINSMALGANSYTTKDNQIVIGDDNIVETLLKGTVIINEIGNSTWDFRVETDVYDALFVDASNDSIEIMSNVAGKVGFFGIAAVVQSTGWAMSNVTPDKILDCNATTLDELADVVGTLVDQLKLHGILGA